MMKILALTKYSMILQKLSDKSVSTRADHSERYKKSKRLKKWGSIVQKDFAISGTAFTFRFVERLFAKLNSEVIVVEIWGMS